MTEPELRQAIARAFCDMLDTITSYAAEQITHAVTPRPPTGEPDDGVVRHEDHDRGIICRPAGHGLCEPLRRPRLPDTT